MLVLFDIGSTLIDGPSVGPAKRIAAGLELPDDTATALNQLLFQTDTSSPDELAALIAQRFATDTRKTEAVVTELWAMQTDEAWLIPGARETLERFRRADIACAYVSNIWPPFYRGFLKLMPEQAALYPRFLSFEMGISKPDTNMYRRVLDSLTAAPSETVMVGDTYKNDIAPAIALGLKTVWLLHRPDKERKDLAAVLNNQAPRPSLTLESISQLTPDMLST
ncbi:MAG: HAD family hydrolase [Gammaproteobacteria bacterium]